MRLSVSTRRTTTRLNHRAAAITASSSSRPTAIVVRRCASTSCASWLLCSASRRRLLAATRPSCVLSTAVAFSLSFCSRATACAASPSSGSSMRWPTAALSARPVSWIWPMRLASSPAKAASAGGSFRSSSSLLTQVMRSVSATQAARRSAWVRAAASIADSLSSRSACCIRRVEAIRCSTCTWRSCSSAWLWRVRAHSVRPMAPTTSRATIDDTSALRAVRPVGMKGNRAPRGMNLNVTCIALLV